jgi:sialate O-acetylesterase
MKPKRQHAVLQQNVNSHRVDLWRLFFQIFYPLIFALAFAHNAAATDLQPSNLFSDGAVLQRGQKIPIWGMAKPGEKITVSLNSQSGQTVADASGSWRAVLPEMSAGGPFDLVIRGNKDAVTLRDVWVGDVWLCSGQSNMDLQLASLKGGREAMESLDKGLPLRFLRLRRSASSVPVRDLHNKWKTPEDCEALSAFSGLGFFFAAEIARTQNVPVGIIQAAWGATPIEAWSSREAMVGNPYSQRALEAVDKGLAGYPEKLRVYWENYEKATADFAAAVQKLGPNLDSPAPGAPLPEFAPAPADPAALPSPSHCFNGMIFPLIPYPLRGVIWYQGEQNVGSGWDYASQLESMFGDWRARWGLPELQILVVQLPPHKPIQTNPGPSGWAELREAQKRFSEKVPHVAMVVTTDVGSEKDIHPVTKKPIAERLALAALRLVYGEAVQHSGPVLKEWSVQGNRMQLQFDHADGLRAGTFLDNDGKSLVKDGVLSGFTLAGNDRVFHPAEAQIEGRNVILQSPAVPAPVAARYGWADYPVVNLQNSAGLWASPFRTDDWPLPGQKPPPSLSANPSASPVPPPRRESHSTLAVTGPFLVKPVSVDPSTLLDNGWSIPGATIDSSGFGAQDVDRLETGRPFVFKELPFAYPDVSRVTGSAWSCKAPSPSTTLLFDLGKTYLVSGVCVWNGAGEKSTRHLHVEVANSQDTSTIPREFQLVSTGGKLLKRCKGGPIVPDFIAFPKPMECRWIRLSGFSGYSKSFGLEEIRAVAQPTPTSEPKATDATKP